MSINNVKIIVGSHGSGKSDWIYNHFFSCAMNDKKGNLKLNLDKKLYLVVPEQDTNEKQRHLMNIADKKGLGAGIFNIDVVSFDRLAHMVFEVLDIEPEEKNIIGDDAKTMMLALTLSRLHNEKKIKYYDKMSGKIGFARKLTQVVSEFYSYNISEEKIEPIVKDLNDKDLFRNKLSDLMLIYNEFTRDLKNKCFSIREDKYDLLNKNIDKVDIFDGAIIAFDGFTGFTPVQMEIFKKLILKASEVYVAIDIRCEKNDLKTITNNLQDETDTFLLSKKFINDLYKATSEVGKEIKISDFIYCRDGLDIKYKGKNDLALIEKNIFRYGIDFLPITSKNIEIFTAKNANEEVINAINIIKNFVKDGKYRYGDIKIVVPNIEDYSDRILKIFNEAKIPVFVDDSTGLLNSPYIETVRAAIDVVNYDFTYDSVMRYINAGIVKKDYNIHKFDNFILLNGIRGHERYKNGFKDLKGSECAEEIRKSILLPLVTLYDQIYENHTAIEYTKALKDFIKNTDLDKSFTEFISVFVEKFSKDNDFNRQYAVLKESFNVLNKTFSNILIINKDDGNKIDLNDFKKLLDIGFTEKSIKSIPYRVDQVVVGDIMRSRFDNPKIEIIMGMNQSKVPASSSDLSLIDDDMREKFSRCNIKLSQTTFETTLNQRFYIYLILTNPSDKLILSYPKLNASNNTDEISPILISIKKMFEKIEEREVVIEDKEPKKYDNKDDSDISKQLLKELSFRYVKDTKKDTYEKKEYESSVSSIEQFNSCPYKYFLDHTIGIKEREVYDISSADMGSYCHCIMEYIFRGSQKGNPRITKLFEVPFNNKIKNFTSRIDKFEIAKLVESAMNELEKSNDESIKKFKIRKNTFGINKLMFIKERVRHVLITTISLLIGFQESSLFNTKNVKTYTEYEFHDSIGKNKFKGYIDRIDTIDANIEVSTNDNTSDENELEKEKATAKSDESGAWKEMRKEPRTFISIIDYKSSGKKITIEDIKDGIKLQLLVYLSHSINENKFVNCKAFICGAYYVVMEDPVVKISNIDELKLLTNEYIDEKKKEKTIYNGIFNVDKNALNAIHKGLEEKKSGENGLYVDKTNGYKIDGVFLHENRMYEIIEIAKDGIMKAIDDIQNGVIKVKPYDDKVCEYCPYAVICRKDQKDLDNEEMELESENGTD